MPAARIKDLGNVQDGLAIREVILDGKSRKIVNKRYIKFGDDSIETYKTKFESLIEDGYIMPSCTFESDTWYGLDDKRYVYFKFEKFKFKNELYEVFKRFVILLLHDLDLDRRMLSSRMSLLYKEIVNYGYFEEKYIGDFEEYVLSDPPNKKLFVQALRLFFYYYSVNASDQYDEILRYVDVGGENEVRDVPEYSSVMWFDYLINKFISEFKGNTLKKYYPIYLWWKITSIIPIRIGTFMKLDANCITQLENGEYLLKINRVKKRRSFYQKKHIPIIDELRTNKELYDIVRKYSDLMGIREDEKLLSLNAFSEIVQLNGRVIKDRLIYEDFVKILNSFYEEIIIGHYGFTIVKNNDEIDFELDSRSIVKIRPGDTRHLAFCSLMAQGFNPIAIAEMGGHTQLSTQSAYGSYLNEHIVSYSQMLVKYLVENEEKKFGSFDEKLMTKDKIKLMFRHKGETPQMEIEGGFCFGEKIPDDCTEIECIDCNDFGIDFNKVDKYYLQMLSERVEKFRVDLLAKTEILRKFYEDIINDGSINHKELTLDKSVQGDLRRLSDETEDAAMKEARMLARLKMVTKAYEEKMEIENGKK